MSVQLESKHDELRAATRPGITPFLVYVALFHLAWAAWPWLLYPTLTAALGEDTLAYAVVQLSIRCTAWIAPVWLYLRYVDRVDPIEYLRLKRRVGRGRGRVTAASLHGSNCLRLRAVSRTYQSKGS